MRTASADVGDFDLFCACRIACMLHADSSAVETDPDLGGIVVETRVVHSGGDDIFHRAAGRGSGNEGTHQQPGDGSVAIGEVEDVRLFFLLVVARAAFGEFHSGETGKAVLSAIVGRNA